MHVDLLIPTNFPSAKYFKAFWWLIKLLFFILWTLWCLVVVTNFGYFAFWIGIKTLKNQEKQRLTHIWSRGRGGLVKNKIKGLLHNLNKNFGNETKIKHRFFQNMKIFQAIKLIIRILDMIYSPTYGRKKVKTES